MGVIQPFGFWEVLFAFLYGWVWLVSVLVAALFVLLVAYYLLLAAAWLGGRL